MDIMKTADYGQPDGPYTSLVHFARGTTTELTALATAKQIGVGQLYYDTTAGAFRAGYDPAILPLALLGSGSPVNSTPIGPTTPSTGSFTTLRATSLQAAFTDTSGTPGNATINTVRGRCAFAAAGTSVTVTNSQCAANSTVLCQVVTNDGTLKSVSVVPGAGSFVITGNAAATGTTIVDFLVIQN